MKKITGKNIGLVIREILQDKQMTQGDIHRSTGIKRSYISAIVNGRINAPTIITLNKIAKALDITLTELVELVENGHYRESKGHELHR